MVVGVAPPPPSSSTSSSASLSSSWWLSPLSFTHPSPYPISCLITSHDIQSYSNIHRLLCSIKTTLYQLNQIQHHTQTLTWCVVGKHTKITHVDPLVKYHPVSRVSCGVLLCHIIQ